MARLHAVQDKMNVRFDYRKTLAEYEENKKNLEHRYACALYDLGILDKANPRFDMFTKEYTQDMEYLTGKIEAINKDIELANKNLAEIDAQIAKIESGETKMDINTINSYVTKMINRMPTAAALTEIDNTEVTDEDN